MTLSSEIISTAVQIAVFLLIPFLFFLFRTDKTVSFARYLGLFAAREVFFRGFLAKRLIRKFGFRTGNLVQGLIFGMVHLVLFALMGSIPLVPLVIIFLLTTWIGWSLGVVNERYAAGSIVPGWIAHGAGNCLSYFILAFII